MEGYGPLNCDTATYPNIIVNSHRLGPPGARSSIRSVVSGKDHAISNM